MECTRTASNGAPTKSMALGAERSEVLWLVLKGALQLLAVGVAVGLPAALAAGRIISSMLFGLTPADMTTILSATTILLLSGLLASLLPARRAARVEPLAALRYE